MLISKAYAAIEAAPVAMPEVPSSTEVFLWNVGMIIVFALLFYVLLILPQQRRFKEHSTMLSGLKKGDRVVTGGGFIGTLDKIVNDEEAVVDLGGGVKVSVLRSSIQGRSDKILRGKPANDPKSNEKAKG
ncbi:MAG: preprotein translocase subunit YajC [Alphaproteobacteria bacterium]